MKKKTMHKILSLILIVLFTFNNIGYARDLSSKSHLRVPSAIKYSDRVPDALASNQRAHNAAIPKIDMDLLVLPYDEPASEDVLKSGPKGSQLAKKRRQLGSVSPDGFNITLDSHRLFLLENPDLVELAKEVIRLDINDAQKRIELAERCQDYIMHKAKFPKALYGNIEKQILILSRKLGYPEGEVVDLAYRGSGPKEDVAGQIPEWFVSSTGAQPGQGTSELHQHGLDKIDYATRKVMAGVFNDQIFGYRDRQLFFSFIKKIGEPQYRELISLLRKHDYKTEAVLIEKEQSPGYVQLLAAIQVIEDKEESIKQHDWSKKLKETGTEMLDPFSIITAVSVLEQIDSYLSGTIFTSRMATGFDGSTFARVSGETIDKKDFSGFTRFMQVNIGSGMGPGIVDAAIVPDMLSLFLPKKGGRWVLIGDGYDQGANDIAMVFLEKAFKLIEKKISEKDIKELARLYGIIYKQGETEKGEAAIAEKLGISKGSASTLTNAMEDIWYYRLEPNKHNCSPSKKAELLKKLNLTDDEFFTLASIIRNMNEIGTTYSQTTYIPTPNSIKGRRLLNDDGIQALARMVEEVGNIEGKAAFDEEDVLDRRMDIEFAISICNGKDPSPYKFKMQAYDFVTGEALGEKTFKVTHLQNRPITPERESSKPYDIIFDEMKPDKIYIAENGIKSVARDGLKTSSAAEGVIYEHDPKRSIGEQEDEVKDLGLKGVKVVVLLQEMGAEHDNLVRAACMYGGGAIVWRGNNTSHPYIFAVECGYPIIINPKISPGQEHYFKKGAKVLLEASAGIVWPGGKGIPLVRDEDVIRTDLIPEDTKVGIIASTPDSAEEIVRLGAKSVLSRIEFFINNTVKIYPQAGEAYDNLMKVLQAGEFDITDEDLHGISEFRKYVGQKLDISYKDLDRMTLGDIIDRAYAEKIRVSRKIIAVKQKLDDIKNHLNENGKEHELTKVDILDIIVQLNHPEVISGIRNIIKGYESAREFMADKMRSVSNLLGVLFPRGDKIRAYDNKEKEALLYGLVGAPLYLNYKDSDQRYDSPLVGLRGSSLMAHPHFKKGFLHLNRGILQSIKDGFINNSFFFVFVRTPEEIEIQVADFEKQCMEEGVFPKEIGVMIETPVSLWIIDEISDILNAFKDRHSEVEKVFVSFGTNDWTKTMGNNSREDRDVTSLVKIMDPALIDVEPAAGRIKIDEDGMIYGPTEKGEPFILEGDDEAAPVMLRMAEHVISRAKKNGVDTSLCGSLVNNELERGHFDVLAKFVSMLGSIGAPRKIYVKLSMIDHDVKASKKRVKENELADLKSVATLSNVAQKGVLTGEVVYIDKPEDIRKIRQGDNKDKIVIVRAALGAIEELKAKGIKWDYLRYARAIFIKKGLEGGLELFKETKDLSLRVKGEIDITAPIKEGEIATVDYNNSSMYIGEAPVDIIENKLQEIILPDHEPKPEKKLVVEENAADVARAIDIHPLAFVGYEDAESEPGLKNAKGLKSRIAKLLNGQAPMQYLEDKFYDAMVSAAEANPNGIVVHNTFNMTRNDLRKLAGGEAIEKTKGREGDNFDDRHYRLYGGARNLADFWKIHRAELRAYKRAKLQHSNLRLQLTSMSVRSREFVEGQLRVLRSLDIDPGKEGIGLKLTSQADVLYVKGYTDGEGNYIKGYIDLGIRFFSYDEERLAASILAANLQHPDIFVRPSKEDVAERALKKPVLYVLGAIKEAESLGVWLAVEAPKATETRKLASNKNVIPGTADDAGGRVDNVELHVSKKGTNKEMNEIKVRSAASVIKYKDKFMKWLASQPSNYAVVVIAMDEDEYKAVEVFKDLVHLKVVYGEGLDELGLNADQILILDETQRIKLSEELDIYTAGIGLDTLSERLDKKAIKAIGSGV